MKIGINTDCSCGSTCKETLQNVKAAGFENIMLAERSGDLETNLCLAREMGLGVSSVHLSYNDVNDLWKSGQSNRDFVKNFIRRLEILGKYNVKVADIHASYVKNRKEQETPSAEQAIATMKEILEVACKLGINIAVENLNLYLTVFTQILLDNINSPNLGLCYDAGHKNLWTPTKDLLATYGSRCFTIHLHDNFMDDQTGSTAELDHHMLPFDGKIDFAKEMRDLATVGYDGVIMLEVNRYDWVNNVPRPIYEKLSIVDFLKLAKTRAEKLAENLFKNKFIIGAGLLCTILTNLKSRISRLAL